MHPKEQKRREIVDEQKRREIVDMFKKSWNGYKKHAWGYDEIFPISKKGRTNWGDVAVTMIDAVDTGIVMNLDDVHDDVARFFEFKLDV